MKVGDLVQEKLTMQGGRSSKSWASIFPCRRPSDEEMSGDRLGRVGIIMEATQIQMPEGDPDIMAMVLWTGNTDWEIIYPEDVIVISEAVQ